MPPVKVGNTLENRHCSKLMVHSENIFARSILWFKISLLLLNPFSSFGYFIILNATRIFHVLRCMCFMYSLLRVNTHWNTIYDWRHEKRVLIFRRHNSQFKWRQSLWIWNVKSRHVNPEIVLLAAFNLHFLYTYTLFKLSSNMKN